MGLTIFDAGIIGGGFFGLAGIFFPKFLFYISYPVGEKEYDKKDAWKYRLTGVVMTLFAFGFYYYDNFIR